MSCWMCWIKHLIRLNVFDYVIDVECLALAEAMHLFANAKTLCTKTTDDYSISRYILRIFISFTRMFDGVVTEQKKNGKYFFFHFATHTLRNVCWSARPTYVWIYVICNIVILVFFFIFSFFSLLIQRWKNIL